MIFSSATYDLICLDNFMPILTGEETVRELRSHDRDDFVVGKRRCLCTVVLC